MSNLRAFAVLLLAFLNPLSGFAQADLKSFVNTQPPNVASFQKYGNTPINYSTGQISQSINLYSLDIDANLRIPIDLLYSNSGLKPDAVPSWVGNGWDLMPGGYILQEIRGADDLMPGGLSRTPAAKQKLDNYLNGQMTSPSDKYYYIKNALKGVEDTQPDFFSLNLLGRSLSFYLDGTTAKLVNDEPVKIELISPNGFIITDEKGYQYHFLNATASSGTLSDDLYEAPGGTGSRTWGLDKIITPNNDVVSFNYIIDAQYFTTSTGTSFTWGPAIGQYSGNSAYQCIPAFTGPNYSNSTAEIAQSVLASISYKGRTVTFETIARNDIKTESSSVPHALSAIKVRNEQNELIKSVLFQYNNGQRLKLDQVSILDATGTLSPQIYKFAYYDYYGRDISSIPLITSANRVYGLDYWGYYNGMDANTPLSITDMDYSHFFPGLTTRIGHNDHNANGDFSLIGMLKKITYPTGGYTTYAYEPNKMIYNSFAAINPFFRNDVTPLNTDIFSKVISCFDDGSSSSSGDAAGTFQVGSNPNISIDWSFTTDDNRDYGSLKIRKVGDAQDFIDVFDKTTSGSKIVSLTPGTYQYQLHIACDFVGPTSRNTASFTVRSFVYPAEIPVTVGGNRIVKIQDFDKTGVPSLTRKINYSNVGLNQEPNYFDQYNVVSEAYVQSTWPSMVCGPVNVIGERNVFELPGFLITYKKVTELLGENGEIGKTEYYYDGPAYIGGNYGLNPYPPVVHLSWRDQDLQRKVLYRRSGPDFIKRQSTGYAFTPTPADPHALATLKGIKFGVQGRVVLGYENPEYYSKYFNMGSLFYPTDRHAELAVADTLFNDDGTTIVNTSALTYTSEDFLRASEKRTDSRGKLTEKRFWYINDYNSISNISALKTGHFIGLPVKEVSLVNGNMVGGQVFTRDNKGNLAQLHRYENAGLQLMPAHDPNVFYPTGFNPKVQLSYDASNHLNQYLQQDNVPIAVLWGYNGSYPIAEVKNASYQDLITVLGQQTIDRLAGGSPGTDAEVRTMLTALYTDARLSNAPVTTYTYDPLVGMTSMTDAKGETTYYEYDGFQRLINIKDKDGNIIKHTDYHYQGQ